MQKSVITRSAGVVTLVLGLVSAAGPASAAECGWSVRYLPKPAGDSLVQVIGADAHGGYAGFGDVSGVVTWSGTAATVVGNPPGLSGAMVDDMNAAGTIVGEALDSAIRGYRAFSLSNGSFQLLPIPDGYLEAHAIAVNAAGDVLGKVTDRVSVKVVIWRAGVPAVLDIGSGFDPVDLDDDGSVLLNSSEGAHVWSNGAMRGLAAPAGFGPARGQAIRGGKVVGYALDPSSPTPQEAYAHAFAWVDGQPAELADGTVADGINVNGLIAGTTGKGDTRPAVWRGVEADQLSLPLQGSGYVTAVGDNDTIAGHINRAPVVWQCNA
ncbi:hypothetical protein [Amycolatopsis sp. NPDC059657]|uniref:hypothetical protein n=1 Tax=Amycolatopsis sp. NPDC059657 TaxID=3346899 RepID=UPI003670AA29